LNADFALLSLREPAAGPAGRLPSREYNVRDYDLAATLTSGQAFRWRPVEGAWEGVVGRRWVRLGQQGDVLRAETAGNEPGDWAWLEEYLQVGVPLAEVIASFPADDVLRAAVRRCHGLRLLRQEVWECLASFILSSTKQIMQIQSVVEQVCERFGDPLPAPAEARARRSFPSAVRIASLTERQLRDCGMGFRAPYLLESARMIAAGNVDPEALKSMDLERARQELMRLPGVGRKIADCVLLFAVGHSRAFPVDVWILRILRDLYFAGRPVPLRTIQQFSEEHFGTEGGYAQQYLFHYARLQAGKLA